MTVKSRLAVLLTGTLLSGFAASTAIAAPAQVDRNPTKVADAVQAQPATAVDDEDSATCSKSRKRLWVEGEGWIVRRITICR
ncbi:MULTISPECIES: hypothetical protein [Methylobacterium]|uniref:Uncharacterized protein n=2 Tax=Methylobacterium thuringiense TaxID=1003091 RepID=A0ABQ4TQG2_9HYPH|nr:MULTISPECIES: hypothetical protein [Methylobacterium]TXN24206.1 hypothetical protein FV217_03925 [Methylobacterium sp. WL9]GJE56347.1 hypothetical protein EKPJFOCH_2849 [Methylobacterium thuringiense]